MTPPPPQPREPRQHLTLRTHVNGAGFIDDRTVTLFRFDPVALGHAIALALGELDGDMLPALAVATRMLLEKRIDLDDLAARQGVRESLNGAFFQAALDYGMWLESQAGMKARAEKEAMSADAEEPQPPQP